VTEQSTEFLDITRRVSGGELSLGRFQSIICAELDGPCERSVDIQLIGV